MTPYIIILLAVICFAGHDTDVYRWEDLMRRGTYELYKAVQEA